jgi:hypothetical protein
MQTRHRLLPEVRGQGGNTQVFQDKNLGITLETNEKCDFFKRKEIVHLNNPNLAELSLFGSQCWLVPENEKMGIEKNFNGDNCLLLYGTCYLPLFLQVKAFTPY